MMWCRTWGLASCLVWLAFACGKTEPGDGHDDAGAGSTAGSAGATTTDGGSTATVGGRPNSAGSSAGGRSGSSAGAAGHPSSVGGSNAVGGASSAMAGQPSEPEQAGAPPEAGASGCGDYYHACGCGCCVGSMSPATCVYTDLGQDLAAIVAEDVAKKHDLQACAAAGCNIGHDYFCCAAPPATNDGASYEANWIVGAIDRIQLYKAATVCSTLRLEQTFSVTPPVENPFPVEVPAGWKLEMVTSLPCTSSAIGPRAIGAIGKISLRLLNGACVVDAHLAAFFTNDRRELNSVRFDADGVPLKLSVGQCK